MVLSDPACGCGSYRNTHDVEGAIALVKRENSSFVSKVVKVVRCDAVRLHRPPGRCNRIIITDVVSACAGNSLKRVKK